MKRALVALALCLVAGCATTLPDEIRTEYRCDDSDILIQITKFVGHPDRYVTEVGYCFDGKKIIGASKGTPT